MTNTMLLESPAMIPTADELSRMFPDLAAFGDLSDEELMALDGGINWDRIFGGAATFLGATLAVGLATEPIGWAAVGAYWGLSAVCGGYIGLGVAT